MDTAKPVWENKIKSVSKNRQDLDYADDLTVLDKNVSKMNYFWIFCSIGAQEYARKLALVKLICISWEYGGGLASQPGTYCVFSYVYPAAGRICFSRLVLRPDFGQEEQHEKNSMPNSSGSF
jgi:hypothetical protein